MGRATAITLNVSVPSPGVNNCANPFVASGSVQPANVTMTAKVVTPTGSLQGTVVVKATGAWTCTFATNPPSNVSLSFQVVASDINGQSVQDTVPFSCGAVPVPG